MEVHLEHDWLNRSFKVWFIERGPGYTHYLVPAPGEAGDVWKTIRAEDGTTPMADVVPLTLSDQMVYELRDALNQTDLPMRNSDASQTLIDVLRVELERNNQRVDKMIDSLIDTSKNRIVVAPNSANIHQTGEHHG